MAVATYIGVVRLKFAEGPKYRDNRQNTTRHNVEKHNLSDRFFAPPEKSPKYRRQHE